MDLQEIMLNLMDWDTIIPALIRIVLIIALAILVNIVLARLMKRIELRIEEKGKTDGELPSESRRRSQTIAGLARQAIGIAVWLVAGMLVLQEGGVEVGPILAGAGIAGVALGFGAQALVADLIAGFFIILENQVRVGDAVKVNGTWGYIEKISFRTLILRDFSGEVHIFPNGSISTLSNESNGWSAYVFHMGVAYKENVDEVMEVMRGVISQMAADETWGSLMLGEGQVQGLQSFDDSAVTIRGRIKTHPLQQYDVGREFNRRIKLAFDEKGIEIPFPHRTLYYGEASRPFEISRTESNRESA